MPQQVLCYEFQTTTDRGQTSAFVPMDISMPATMMPAYGTLEDLAVCFSRSGNGGRDKLIMQALRDLRMADPRVVYQEEGEGEGEGEGAGACHASENDIPPGIVVVARAVRCRRTCFIEDATRTTTTTLAQKLLTLVKCSGGGRALPDGERKGRSKARNTASTA